MKRIPEPPLMENPLQAKVYAEADFSNTDFLFLARLEELLLKNSRNPGPKSVIMDLGCGPGNITERLAARWPMAKVIGVDGSEAMLSIARERQLKSSKVIQKIDYRNIFLSFEKIRKSTFSATANILVSNSLLHHYPDPAAFWEVIKTLSSSGAYVFHRDLVRPSHEEQILLLQKKYLPDCHYILKSDYLASLRASFTLDEVKEQLLVHGLEKLEVIISGDRYLEVFGQL
ncbi:class I SAM-dependent methyltransferase [Prochlorococcus sp. MIT 1341]|uniref:class I SAM-dependent methyltransferase n=1 Tax=Prochlorococcus sp. MIT 1341 TaxID=3096221 RepID=UPI002A75A84D|nr:class I SAM-dependent methyltransferase [Prochlorococcus sp. MIT 1341]